MKALLFVLALLASLSGSASEGGHSVSEHFTLAIESIFVNNMVFAVFLGMCSYLALSKKVDIALGLGVAVVFVMAITIPACYLISAFFLRPDTSVLGSDTSKASDLSFLTFISFIAVIAAVVQLLEMAIEKMSAKLYNALGVFLPLIAVNCAILGGALLLNDKGVADPSSIYNSFWGSVNYGLTSGIGWLLAIVALAGAREKMSYSNVPAGLRGLGITFATTGLMAMAFMGFGGINLNKLSKQASDAQKHQAAAKAKADKATDKLPSADAPANK
jgi:Na+-transporting NADH:ubiquinone oxidoreductase subunit E